LWKPGMGYPAPVIFHSNDADELVGFDLVKKGKVYACRIDGEHLWTLEARLKMGNLLAPEFFRQEGSQLVFRDQDGRVMEGTITGGTVGDLQESDTAAAEYQNEVHFPHTHVTRDGSLWVFDFDPMPRVTRLRMVH
jgi:hypothetical protein